MKGIGVYTRCDCNRHNTVRSITPPPPPLLLMTLDLLALYMYAIGRRHTDASDKGSVKVGARSGSSDDTLGSSAYV